VRHMNPTACIAAKMRCHSHFLPVILCSSLSSYYLGSFLLRTRWLAGCCISIQRACLRVSLPSVLAHTLPLSPSNLLISGPRATPSPLAPLTQKSPHLCLLSVLNAAVGVVHNGHQESEQHHAHKETVHTPHEGGQPRYKPAFVVYLCVCMYVICVNVVKLLVSLVLCSFPPNTHLTFGVYLIHVQY